MFCFDHVMVKIYTTPLNSSVRKYYGDAPEISDVWHHLVTVQQTPVEYSRDCMCIKPKGVTVYDCVADDYVPLEQMLKYKLPEDKRDWRITHFDDGRSVVTTANHCFMVTNRKRNGRDAVKTKHLVFGDAIARDSRLWYTRHDKDGVQVRRDLVYGDKYAQVIGFDTWESDPCEDFYLMITATGLVTVNGISMCGD